MATEAQIAANRRNSELSSGPKSPEGKDRSRRNSLRHGLTASKLRTDEEVEALGEGPDMPVDEPISSPLVLDFVRKQIDLISYRIEHAALTEIKLRERSALRAATCWDEDRRCEVETLALSLPKKPAHVAAKLEQTPQGCLWKLERWAMLARAADRDGGWDEAMTRLAFDLLGTPLDLRGGRIGEQIDCAGQVVETGVSLLNFAQAQAQRLLALREKLAEADALDRSAAEQGLSHDPGVSGRLLRRYESELQSRLRWYLKFLEKMTAEPAPEKEEDVKPAERSPALSRLQRRARQARRRQAGEPSRPQSRLQE